VVEASDNLETKALMNELSVQAGLPLVWGAVARFEGQWGRISRPRLPQLRLPAAPRARNVPDAGRIGHRRRSGGVIGALQATEALKVWLGIARHWWTSFALGRAERDFDGCSWSAIHMSGVWNRVRDNLSADEQITAIRNRVLRNPGF
jgi:molybdopterin/thiamine biosynthesis adenylyltransferase